MSSFELRLAHLSDWHATTLAGGGLGLLRPKRLSGWASWRLSRRRRHRREILDAAIRDVHRQEVDLSVVTGDLTHVSLEQEFAAASQQLAGLGPPDRVFLVPGNHDRYVAIAAERSWDHWAPYLAGTAGARLDPALAACLAGNDPGERAPRHGDYPTLRVVGDVAIVGLCSAIATPVFRAGGVLGASQLERLSCLLPRLRERGLFRILLVHHPITEGSESPRRALRDAAQLRALLAREGAELVLHGHKHRRRVHRVPGPEGSIPVLGVPSASEVGSRPGKRAQYHLYRIRPDAPRPEERIAAEIRGYDPACGEFVPVAEGLLDERVGVAASD